MAASTQCRIAFGAPVPDEPPLVLTQSDGSVYVRRDATATTGQRFKFEPSVVAQCPKLNEDFLWRPLLGLAELVRAGRNASVVMLGSQESTFNALLGGVEGGGEGGMLQLALRALGRGGLRWTTRRVDADGPYSAERSGSFAGLGGCAWAAADDMGSLAACATVDGDYPCADGAAAEKRECEVPTAVIDSAETLSSCPGTVVRLDGRDSTGGGAAPPRCTWGLNRYSGAVNASPPSPPPPLPRGTAPATRSQARRDAGAARSRPSAQAVPKGGPSRPRGCAWCR